MIHKYSITNFMDKIKHNHSARQSMGPTPVQCSQFYESKHNVSI